MDEIVLKALKMCAAQAPHVVTLCVKKLKDGEPMHASSIENVEKRYKEAGNGKLTSNLLDFQAARCWRPTDQELAS